MTIDTGLTFYDRDGNVITIEEWSKLRLSGKTVVEKTTVNNYEVSTVLIGYDANLGFNDGPPIIFETMIFDTAPDDEDTRWDDVYMDRYATEQEARDGHARAIEHAKGLPNE